MVSVYLFININCTGIRFGVDAFGSGIKDHTVDAFADWNAGDLLPRRRIDHHHDFAAATHKQAMRGFIDRQPDRHFPESERPTDNNRALFAVDHLDSILFTVNNEEARARFLEPHFFHRPALDTDVPEVLDFIRIHDGDQRVV